ncbi:MAG: hypothetical protein H0V66_08980 [Bdellovibrionales bacterium]|nr:hypothetical protein [Bdellovibrionales bacterium]
MKNLLSIIFVPLLLTQYASAQTPSLNSINEWSKQKAQYEADKTAKAVGSDKAVAPQLSDSDKAEIGTFFLLHSMAKKGLIGKGAGICVNYGKGDEGSGDRISFGIKGDAENLGSADCNKLPEVAKSIPIIEQMGKFFKNGCAGKTDCMSVNVTGYSDGVRNTGAVNPSDSYSYNADLAEKRANCYDNPLKTAGLNNFGSFEAQGKSSRYGQYLDIMNKEYGGNPNSMMAKLSKDEKDYFEPLYKKYGKKYKIKCDRRRVTVMDFKFNSSSAQVNQDPGKSGPTLYSGGSEFNKASFMDAVVQVASVTKDDLTGKDDAFLDRTMENILKKNGINDPAVIENCKNPQARKVLKYFSARMKVLSAANKNAFYAKVDSGKHSELLSSAITDNPSSAEGLLFIEMTQYFDKSKRAKMLEQNHPFPGLDSGGMSSTALNCFSAKNAIQNMLSRDSDRLAKACKPVGHNTVDGKLSVEFSGRDGLHIGCDACKSGLHMAPTSDGKLSYVYKPRDNQSKKSGPQVALDAQKKYPITPEQLDKFADELVNFTVTPVTDPKYLNTKGIQKPIVKICMDDILAFQKKIKETSGINESERKKKNKDIDLGDASESYTVFRGTACKDIVENNVVMSPGSKELMRKLYTPYIASYVTGSFQKKYGREPAEVDPKADYDKLRNPQNHYEEKFLNVQGLLHDSPDKNAHMTMGGLKSPSYYIVKDCNCSDKNLMDKVANRGEFHQMDIMPIKDEVASSGDACIVSLPVPTSCMVEINNATTNSNAAVPDPSIKWLDADGKEVNTVLKDGLGDLNTKLNELNSNFDFDKSCPPGDAMAQAQAVVKSLGCNENEDIQLPHGDDEFADCVE